MLSELVSVSKVEMADRPTFSALRLGMKSAGGKNVRGD
jgi:hypothetical protein